MATISSTLLLNSSRSVLPLRFPKISGFSSSPPFPRSCRFEHRNLEPLSNGMFSSGSRADGATAAATSVEGVMTEAMKLIQSTSPTWKSAVANNLLIFVLGSPLLVTGLSASGIAAAFLLGTLTWRAYGSAGFLLVAAYFVMGTAATKVKMSQKEAQGVAEKRKGRRGPRSVIGSSAAGCVCAFLSIYQVGGAAFSQLFRLGFVSSFCTKVSDTVSSEIGKAYGKTTYLVTTFKIDLSPSLARTQKKTVTDYLTRFKMPSESSSYKLHRPAKPGGSRRDSSPDSIIFTPESNLSLFSSASVSVDRCSSTSDAHDRDSLVSGPSLERDQRVSSSCKDSSDLEKRGTGWKQSRNSRKSNKVKAWKEEFEMNKDDESQNLDSARSSFSVALRECQERKTRSEALAKKLDYQRTASLDLSNVVSSSPRLVTVKRTSVSTNKSSVFPSPGTPTYLHSMQKGWSSERIPLRTGGRSPPNAGFLPLYSGRTVPSKWEDAERWIVSPLAKEGAARTSFGASHERRPKAKSGPLGPPGLAYYSLYSPAVPMVHGGNMGGLTACSPFSAGVLPETVSSRGSTTASAFPQRIDPCMARSVSIHGCSVVPSSQDDIHESIKDAANDARAVSRRDMATQMSPEGSIRLSPERQCSFSPSSPSALPISELLNAHSNRAEVKDLQVDEKVTVTRWSKKHRGLYYGNSSKMRDHLHGKARDPQSSTCAKTEEASITSWENLQKAKAEAAIRKLEMKLEKKRTSSMEKIMRKVKSAEKRAEEMRRSVLDNKVSAASNGKVLSFKRSGKKNKLPSLSGCFTCHAF